MVICTEKSQQTLGLDRPVPHDPPSCRLLYRRAQRGGLSKTVGARADRLSRGTLLHGLLGSLSKGPAVRTTHGVWQRCRANQSRRTMEQYVTPTPGTLCPPDTLLFQIRNDARGLFAFVPSSLQSFSLSHLIYPLPKKEVIKRCELRKPCVIHIVACTSKESTSSPSEA
jgi:hypothetical protein